MEVPQVNKHFSIFYLRHHLPTTTGYGPTLSKCNIMLGINRVFSVPMLKSSANYHDWLMQLKMYLYTEDLWVCICINPPLHIYGGTSTATLQSEQVISSSPSSSFTFGSNENKDKSLDILVKHLGEKEAE